MQMNLFRNHSRLLLVGLLSMVVGVSALAQSVPFPTYQTGPHGPGSWVLGDGAIITPAGTQFTLVATESSGTGVRAKAIALNPNAATSGTAMGHHTAAVLTMGAYAVQVFDVQTGALVLTYKSPSNKGGNTGSSTGITYTSDGKYLLFSQDGPKFQGQGTPAGYVAIASVQGDGTLLDYADVQAPMAVDSNGNLTTVTCFPYNDLNGNVAGGSPPGTTGGAYIPCGQTVSIVSDSTYTSYPLGIALSSNNNTAYVVLDNNNTLAKIDLTQHPPVLGSTQIRVGNVPNSVAISSDGRTAYVSNEAGRVATKNDFQEYSNGIPVVAVNPTGSLATATISVVDLPSWTLKGTITLSGGGVHPVGMAWWGQYLLVANAYSDNISVIDSTTNTEVRKINLGLPIGTPGSQAAGGNPNSIAVDAANGIGYVALYNANAIAVVDLHASAWQPVKGMIPVGYGPSSVVLDSADNLLLVANDKGIGTTNTPPIPPPSSTCATYYKVCGYNSHQDQGTVSIVPIPGSAALAKMTTQVYQNNHWDLQVNIQSASGGKKTNPPVAIPAKIGDPSLIKHVFVIIRENRTYDQVLGDVAGGNGDPALAVFGVSAPVAPMPVTPNAHAIVERFPLLDNFYDPSRQSADGHNWIVQAMAPYSDDIQSPDWLRDYPSNGGDALAYQTKGFLWDALNKAGVSWKNYGEYIEYNRFNTSTCTSDPNNSATCEPTWCQFYADTLAYESGSESQLQYYNTVSSFSPLPTLMSHTIENYPQFDLGIPDQFRVDIWKQDFAKDVAAGMVPQFEMMWISSDHTGGPPSAQAMQADNDLALGRFVDIISHSPIWSSSVIFVEEDDAQNGVDHVDGHRSPGYVISPYVVQSGSADHTYYTQVNMTRTIEQILGVAPMNQRDLVASPMRTLFTDTPPTENFQSWTHVLNAIPLSTGTSCSNLGALKIDSPVVAALRDGWLQKKAEIFAGKYQNPDSEDPDTVSHYNWYEATGFKVPYPGDKVVRPASEFNRPAPTAKADKDDDDE